MAFPSHSPVSAWDKHSPGLLPHTHTHQAVTPGCRRAGDGFKLYIPSAPPASSPHSQQLFWDLPFPLSFSFSLPHVNTVLPMSLKAFH